MIKAERTVPCSALIIPATLLQHGAAGRRKTGAYFFFVASARAVKSAMIAASVSGWSCITR
jgi:hypothetical protein